MELSGPSAQHGLVVRQQTPQPGIHRTVGVRLHLGGHGDGQGRGITPRSVVVLVVEAQAALVDACQRSSHPVVEDHRQLIGHEVS